MKTLIALTIIAAGALAEGSAEVAEGQVFEASDTISDQLIETGVAKVYVEVPAGKKVKVRVLTSCVHGRADQVVTLSAADAQTAQNQGLVDSNAEAVAYAESLAKA